MRTMRLILQFWLGPAGRGLGSDVRQCSNGEQDVVTLVLSSHAFGHCRHTLLLPFPIWGFDPSLYPTISEPIQRHRALLPHPLQRHRIQAQRLQNRRRHLRGIHHARVIHPLQPGITHEARDFPIVHT
jgi:hypothetical protein